jgi:hypothetical protein
MIHEYNNIVKSAYNYRLESAIWYRKYYACRPNMRVEITHKDRKRERDKEKYAKHNEIKHVLPALKCKMEDKQVHAERTQNARPRQKAQVYQQVSYTRNVSHGGVSCFSSGSKLCSFKSMNAF